MKNKKIALLLALSLVCGSFCACGGDESSTAQKKGGVSSYETAELVTNENKENVSDSSQSGNTDEIQVSTEPSAIDNPASDSAQTSVTFNPRALGGTIKTQTNSNASQQTAGGNTASSNQSVSSGNTSDNNVYESTGGNTSNSQTVNQNSNTSSNTSSGNNSAGSSNTSQQNKVTSAPAQSQQTVVTTASVIDTEDAEPVTPAIAINISDSGCSTSDSSAVSISGSTVTINAGGKYCVTGTLSNGQIVVNAPKTDKVNLHLNGASITSGTSAAIYVISADTCVLHVDEGSSNYLADTSSNTLKGCIVSKDDFTIKGDGSLTVSGNKQFGIKSSNDIKIKNGNISVSSVKAAIYGEDSVQITGGNVVVTSCKDGIKTSTTANAEKGFVLIEDGTVDIQNASGNGIEAITYIKISGGSVKVHSAKNALKCDVQTVVPGCFTEY